MSFGNTIFKAENSLLRHGDKGFSYANRYEVEMGLPTKLAYRFSSNDQSELMFRCESISMPGRNLRTVMNGNIYGPPHEIVQGYTFGEVAASFYSSEDMTERTVFEEWQKLAVNQYTYDLNYYKEYTGLVKIFSLNKQDERVYGVELVEAFPKTVEPIAVGHASSNTINKVGVSFQYRYWKNIQLDTGFGDYSYDF